MPAEQVLIKRIRIKQVIEETAEARSFVLEPLDEWQPQYQAGQFLTLVFNTAFGEKRRSYSISSSPGLNEPLTITVKRMANGEFSRRLIDHAKTGDILQTTGISGFFTLPEIKATTGTFFFLAAGSGITPCFSLIKTILFTTDRPVTLIYSNRSASDVIYKKALEELENRFSNRFRIHFLFSNSNNVYQGRLSKWLLTYLLDKHPPAPGSIFYMCGPYGYMQTINITLLGYGIPADHIKKEVFDSTPRMVLPEPPDKEPHTVTIHFQQKEYKLQVKYPVSILAAAKKQNILLPYSCEAGRCGSCVATCTSGKIWMAYNEVLTDDEVNKGRMLTCQAFAIGGDASVSIKD